MRWEDVREDVEQLLSKCTSSDQMQNVVQAARNLNVNRRKRNASRTVQVEEPLSKRPRSGTAPGNNVSRNPNGMITPPESTAKVCSPIESSEDDQSMLDRTLSGCNDTVSHQCHTPTPDDQASSLAGHGQSSSSTSLRSENPAETLSEVALIYQSLEAATDGPSMLKALKKGDSCFESGVETLLHVAVKKANIEVVRCILDYMLSQELEVDATDAEGQTALHRAVFAGDSAIVDALLTAGANVWETHGHFGPPLQIAIQHTLSLDLCRSLISDDALRISRYGPLSLAVKRMVALTSPLDKARMAAIIELLVSKGADFQGSHAAKDDGPHVDFLRRWLSREEYKTESPHRFQSMLEESLRRSRFRIANFLHSDCNPFCWLSPRYCEECDSFASYVFAHTDCAMGISLIKLCDVVQHGRRLAYLIISPCSKRPRGHYASYAPGALLETLLRLRAEAGVVPSWESDLVNLILEQSPDPEKGPLLQALNKFGVSFTRDPQRSLKALSCIDEEARLRLAEVLLWPGQDLGPRKLYAGLRKTYEEVISTKPSQTKHAFGFDLHTQPTREMYTGAESEILRLLGLSLAGTTAPHAEIILQCVVHVFTQYLLAEEAAGVSPLNGVEPYTLRELFGLDFPKVLQIPTWLKEERSTHAWEHRYRERLPPKTWSASWWNSNGDDSEC